MAKLAQKLPLEQMQPKWAAQLNPLLDNQLTQGQLLSNITLNVGITSIKHGLSRPLVGWLIVGLNAAATIYDGQTTNLMPDKTLVLNSNVAAIISLWVF